MVYVYNGILQSSKNESARVTHHNMNESPKHNYQKMKEVAKEIIQYDSIYLEFKNRQN